MAATHPLRLQPVLAFSTRPSTDPLHFVGTPPSSQAGGGGSGGLAHCEGSGLPSHGVHTLPKCDGEDRGSIGTFSCGMFVALNACSFAIKEATTVGLLRETSCCSSGSLSKSNSMVPPRMYSDWLYSQGRVGQSTSGGGTGNLVDSGGGTQPFGQKGGDVCGVGLSGIPLRDGKMGLLAGSPSRAVQELQP